MSEAGPRRVRELLGRYGDGEAGAIEALVAPEFFTHAPGLDEPDATDVFVGLAAEFKAAAPDLRVDIPDLTEADDGTLTGVAVLEGTWIGELWDAAPSGESYTFSIPVTIRPSGDRFAIRADLDTPAVLAILRELELVNPPDQMHLPSRHPVVIPDIVLKLIFTGQVTDKPCTHLGDIQVFRSEAALCDDCESGEISPALRMCLHCGHVGCCDTATHKHAKAHWEQSGHPLMRSIRMDEGWLWCYDDNAFFEKRTLERIQAQLDAD
jgi:hypothetical protein